MSKSVTQITNLGIKWRGTVISNCSILEKDIEIFIADYFVSDPQKNYVFWTVMLDRFHFDGKISVFETIIKQSCDKTTFKKTYSKLFSELRYVKDERNKFAHYVHLVEGQPTDIVTLLNFRDIIRPVDYNIDTYKSLLKRIERCIKEVRLLNTKVHTFLPAQYDASSAS